MRPISSRVKKLLEKDDWMKMCIIRDGNCSGRITWEHSWLYKNRQIDEAWALVPLCFYHHLGQGFSSEIKDYGRWVSLLRAKPEDLKKYPKKDWLQEKSQLTKKFVKI